MNNENCSVESQIKITSIAKSVSEVSTKENIFLATEFLTQPSKIPTFSSKCSQLQKSISLLCFYFILIVSSKNFEHSFLFNYVSISDNISILLAFAFCFLAFAIKIISAFWFPNFQNHSKIVLSIDFAVSFLAFCLVEKSLSIPSLENSKQIFFEIYILLFALVCSLIVLKIILQLAQKIEAIIMIAGVVFMSIVNLMAIGFCNCVIFERKIDVKYFFTEIILLIVLNSYFVLNTFFILELRSFKGSIPDPVECFYSYFTDCFLRCWTDLAQSCHFSDSLSEKRVLATISQPIYTENQKNEDFENPDRQNDSVDYEMSASAIY